jgi:prepilin-type N-terminal cleavage/methylation domain-containing protein
MKLRNRKSSRAFTLLEIMVAIGLLSAIVVAIYSSWYSIMKGSKVALDAAALAQRTRMTIRTLQDSLLCTCLYTQNARYYAFVGQTEDDLSSLSFVARLPKSFPRSGKFGDLDVRRLTFTVEDARDHTKQLVLRQSPVLLEPDEDEVNYPLVLARDVKSFLIEYPDPSKPENWLTEWVYTNQLPKEARITIELKPQAQHQALQGEKMFGFVSMPGVAVRPEWQIQPGLLGAPTGGLQPGQTNPAGNPLPGGGFPRGGAPGSGFTPTPGQGGGFGPGMTPFPSGRGGPGGEP